jgi:uncharacterized membrane protein
MKEVYYFIVVIVIGIAIFIGLRRTTSRKKKKSNFTGEKFVEGIVNFYEEEELRLLQGDLDKLNESVNKSNADLILKQVQEKINVPLYVATDGTKYWISIKPEPVV